MRTPDHWQSNNLVSLLLRPLGWVYFFLGLLHRKIVRSVNIGVPVICIGNIVAGGAGKTPTAIYIGKLLSNSFKVAFLTRGYGGSLTGPVKVDPEKHTFHEVGDEAILLSRIATTWVSKSRVHGARAAKIDGAEVVIMDDGYQNPQLEKTLSFLVVDGAYGLGNKQLIPSGPLRETLKHGISRADALVVIGQDLHNIQSQVPKDVSLFPVTVSPIISKKLKEARRVVGFAGIAQPSKFLRTLTTLDLEVKGFFPFPDHHKFTKNEILDLTKKAFEMGAQLVTTTKDFVRLPPDMIGAIVALDIELSCINETQIKSLLEQTLEKQNA
ncbi:MAG: tetraacyldisaccharide 4'-kinase [Pseudomonadota bacterium]|nr:tetraacyldisaccharide 4'-kinase [Pseudomonadota bacterium]